MTKTLILVVDRDDDFGNKGNVDTPLIGIDAAIIAAIDLGVADPEDSDVNALLAAVNIYKDFLNDGKDVEIALICGDRKVGHRSDSALVDELLTVIDTVHPDRAILVGDGAEDEYVYPIISSRVPIDSVRKVFVKQAPGVEGTLYIFSKMLSDVDKRKRFLAPIGALLCLISMIYIVQGVYAYSVTGSENYLFSLSAPIVVFVLGSMLMLYAYNMVERIMDYTSNWNKYIHSGNVTITFTILSVSLFVIGLVMGIYSVRTILSTSLIYIALTFIANAMWPIVFAVLFNNFGKMVETYISKKQIARSFMIGTISFLGIVFVIQGGLDFIMYYAGYGAMNEMMVLSEIVMGILFAITASILQASYRKYFNIKDANDAKQ